MVMHHKSELRYEDTDVVFLCFLCERTLSNEESYAHVFSREHIASFLVSIFICFFCGIIFQLIIVTYLTHTSSCQVLSHFVNISTKRECPCCLQI